MLKSESRSCEHWD